MAERTFIIAEAGVNHNGSLRAARRLIDVARAAGADAVKFQTFDARRLVTGTAEAAPYQTKNTGTDILQQRMLKALQLNRAAFRALARYARAKGIEFISTPFEENSADFLGTIGMKRFKIPSGEITNEPLIRRIAAKRRPIILSTGMANLREIGNAIGWIRSEWRKHRAFPGLTLLHCVSLYPAPAKDTNLRAMDTLRQRFRLPVGLSDHSLGIIVPVAAVARGAAVIEKHFTLSRRLRGPDHRASLEPRELRAMVAAIRETESALGSPGKKPLPAERRISNLVRKSLVAARDIPKGKRMCAADICVKRPGTGIAPCYLKRIIGRRAPREVNEDSLLPQCFLSGKKS